MNHRLLRMTLALSLLIGLPGAALAQTDGIDDRAVLAGITSLRVAFDLKDGDARGLLYRLNVIDETRRSLIRQGVTPHFVLTFRGPATRLVQTDLREVEKDDRVVAQAIAAKLAELGTASGVDSMEQCAVAVRDQGIRRENVLPAVRVVGNGWISLMAYQARGYAYIAP